MSDTIPEIKVAALFVLEDGPYANLPGVDPWGIARDARLYHGPHPVVAHPPCARWGRYWNGAPAHPGRFKLGDDGGCFTAALWAVRNYGGVLEHPEGSHAWRVFGINCPPRSGGWMAGGLTDPGWTCCVEQGHYGHRAQKKTWLYAVNTDRPQLKWGPSGKRLPVDAALTREQRRRVIKTGVAQTLSKRKRALTPKPFRDLLLSMARSTYNPREGLHV